MTRVSDMAAKHGGNAHGVNAPTDSSVTFIVDDPDDFGRWFMGAQGVPDGKYLYARQSHPTAVHLGKMLAAMEGAEAGYATASGISVCGIAMLRFARAGDTIVVSDRLYGGTRMFCNMINERFAINVIPVDTTDLAKVVHACERRKAKLLFTEVTSNPDLVVADIPALAAITHECGIPLIVDNTFTPLTIRPIALGADVVVHSLTKYVSSTSKVIAGGIVGKRDFIRSLLHPSTGLLMLLGPVLAPEVADKLRERFAALPLCFAEASKRAMDVALRFSDEGFLVLYPGLPSSPGFNRFLSMTNESDRG
ncbi:MAG: PLP-dependent transferase, partial [Patescibacteria group bacterium]